MKKIRLGRTNLEVSAIGFGGIPVQKPSEQEAVGIIQESLDLGINFIDTSRAYTNSEERIGKAIAGRRQSVILATKSTARQGPAVTADLEQSLKNLQTDYIDLYQFHNVSTPDDLQAVMAPGGALEAVLEARRAGKVGHIGLTSHRLAVAKTAVLEACFETIMVALNFVNTEASHELLPLALERDVGVIIMKPMAGGMLEHPAPAVKYLQQFPEVLTLVGISKRGEMQEIISIAEANEPLTADEKRTMDRIKKELGTGFCRMCNYCQPCEQHIMISGIMYTHVAVTRFAPERIFKGQWNSMMDKISDCSQCGECEKRCPYQIPIRKRIREAAREYAAAKALYMAGQHRRTPGG